MLIGLILYLYNGKVRFISILLILFLSYTSIFISGERTAIVLTLLSSLLMFVFLSEIRKMIFMASLFFGMCLIYIFNFYENVFIRVFTKTINSMNLNNIEKINIFTPHHESIYSNAYFMFKDNIIFGVGPKLFRESCSKYDYACSTHPHNYYLQFLSELGIVGFSFLFIGISHIFWLFFKSIKNRSIIDVKLYNLMICCLTCFIINLVPFVPSGNFFNNWLSIIFFLPLAFVYNLNLKISSMKNV